MPLNSCQLFPRDTYGVSEREEYVYIYIYIYEQGSGMIVLTKFKKRQSQHGLCGHHI